MRPPAPCSPPASSRAYQDPCCGAWPQLFERHRGLVLSAGLLSCRGRVQHQGRVTHVVAEHLTDLTFWLRRIGELDLGRLPTGRGDGARHGGSPDLRGQERAAAAGAKALLGSRPRDIFIPDMRIDGAGASNGSEAAPAIRIRSRDFR